MANGSHTNDNARPGREQPGANVSTECSTSYHEAEDISRADFKAIGTGFQVGAAPGWMLVLLGDMNGILKVRLAPHLEWAGEYVSSTVLSDPCMGYAHNKR